MSVYVCIYVFYIFVYLHTYVYMTKFLGLFLTSLPLFIFLLVGTRVGLKPKALTAATTIRMEDKKNEWIRNILRYFTGIGCCQYLNLLQWVEAYFVILRNF